MYTNLELYDKLLDWLSYNLIAFADFHRRCVLHMV